MYMYMYVVVYVCVYIYIYTHIVMDPLMRRRIIIVEFLFVFLNCGQHRERCQTTSGKVPLRAPADRNIIIIIIMILITTTIIIHNDIIYVI